MGSGAAAAVTVKSIAARRAGRLERKEEAGIVFREPFRADCSRSLLYCFATQFDPTQKKAAWCVPVGSLRCDVCGRRSPDWC